MRQTVQNTSPFLSEMDAAFKARTSASEMQRAAFQRFSRLGAPNRRVEGWKWSDFDAALRNVKPANEDAVAYIAPLQFDALNPIEFQIVNGRIMAPDHQKFDGFEYDIIDPAASDPDFDTHALAALNVAMTPKALGFRTTKDADVKRPILIRHINSGPQPHFTQVLGRVEENSKLTVIETFEGGCEFYSTLFHVALRNGSRLRRYVLQDGAADAITHGFFGAMLGEGAQFEQAALSTGGRLCRHETNVLASAKSGEAHINSAALLSGERHFDATSLVRFSGEGCEVRQTHKSVATDGAKNVFQGKFHVDRSAQKTDAKMAANALLLSDASEANHKPELEIYADDVECAHGSTVGALDDDALFYLRQRGLDEHQARALLIDAFVGEVIESITDDGVREIFAARLDHWLEAA